MGSTSLSPATHWLCGRWCSFWNGNYLAILFSSRPQILHFFASELEWPRPMEGDDHKEVEAEGMLLMVLSIYLSIYPSIYLYIYVHMSISWSLSLLSLSSWHQYSSRSSQVKKEAAIIKNPREQMILMDYHRWLQMIIENPEDDTYSRSVLMDDDDSSKNLWILDDFRPISTRKGRILYILHFFRVFLCLLPKNIYQLLGFYGRLPINPPRLHWFQVPKSWRSVLPGSPGSHPRLGGFNIFQTFHCIICLYTKIVDWYVYIYMYMYIDWCR